MNKPTISLEMIVRDDEPTLEDCLKSLRPHVDEIVIVDTGSTDRSPEIAKRYADKFEVFLGCNDEEGRIEDFSLARNRAHELATGDWRTWADGDDVVHGAENLRRYAQRNDYDTIICLSPYEYTFDGQGNCTCIHQRERLVRPGQHFAWISPVHEVMCPIEPLDGTRISLNMTDVVWEHRKHLSRKKPDPDRNLRILKKHVERSGESDVRALYYLGIEYGARGELGNALHYLRRYVELSGWAEEKYLALLDIARIYQQWGDFKTANKWAFEAMETKSWSEPYWVLMKSYFAMAMNDIERGLNLSRCAHFAQIGLALKSSDGVLFSNPMDRKSVHLWLNQALALTGNIKAAIESCEVGLQELPGHPDLVKNLAIHRREYAKETVLAALEATGLDDASKESVRKIIGGDAVAPDQYSLAAAVEETTAREGKRDIVLFLGPAFEHWTPETLQSGGMGGSETMAWEMAKRLAARGNRVRMYAHCLPTQERVYDGVEFYNWSRYRNLKCDVLVSSRSPGAVDTEYSVDAGCRVLWVHDVHCGEQLNQARELRFDRILALTQWHKQNLLECYRTIDPNKIIVTRNGIDLERFTGTEKRNPHRAIYSSSPDRGLQTLLDIWPRVREQIPDAELHVFYGFLNWERACQERGDMAEMQTVRMIRHLVNATHGVVFHDRVSGQQLAREFMKSQVWANPTWFQETYCITAAEAQAAGCHIICTPIAALNETVGDAGIMVPGDWRSSELMDAFVKHIVEAMQKDGPAKHDASRFSLETLADDWDKMLGDLHDEVMRDVVPKFYTETVVAPVVEEVVEHHV